MKKYYLLIILFITSLTANAQIVDIPDANFKNALVNTNCVDTNGDGFLDEDVDTNDDGEIQVSEAEVVSNLDLTGQDIVSMEGIQSFINIEFLNLYQNFTISTLDVTENPLLKSLNCTFNQLTILDITQNPLLEFLRCDSNQLTELNISQNLNLLLLDCNTNSINSLDTTQNTNLEYLNCGGNQLTEINLLQNILLEYLRIGYNQITNLDVSQNQNLDEMFCDYNQISTLDFTQNPNLERLWCTNNLLTSINFAQNQNLKYLHCQNNLLYNIDVSQSSILEVLICNQNNLLNLNIKNGNNENINRMFAYDNPDLLCINVDDVNFANNQQCNIPGWMGWCKDETTEYDEDCVLGIEDNLQSQFVIYPNPSNEFINIESYYSINTIKVFDILGRLVLEQNNPSNQVDISNLSSGLLFIHIQTENGSINKKILKE